MDREQEITSLKEKLTTLEKRIKGELEKIDIIKNKLSTAYRRRDKEKYQTDHGRIAENLKKYEAEMVEARKKLFELESR